MADALLEKLLSEGSGIAAKDLEMAGDVANVRLAALGARHGFVAGKVHHGLVLDAASIELLPNGRLPPLPPAQGRAFRYLHDGLFPGTYYSAEQPLDMASDGRAVLLGLVDAGSLAGYAAGRIDEGGAGYVDFVGVAPARRREGLGTRLVVAISLALAAEASEPRIRLTVAHDNAAALALYDRLGFHRATSSVAYRRHPQPKPAA